MIGVIIQIVLAFQLLICLCGDWQEQVALVFVAFDLYPLVTSLYEAQPVIRILILSCFCLFRPDTQLSFVFDILSFLCKT